jgi:hypothetical protein
VRWSPTCEDVSPGPEERPMLSQLRVTVRRSEKLVADAGYSSRTQRKANVAVESRYQATASED